ncbi:MAG TPA: hypothetical protein VGE52_08405, partial [Pirellulales bacterium]
MSHTDKAFIKAYRTASKPAPARVAIAPTSAATEPAAPLDARAPGVEPSSGSLAAPSLDAPPSPTVREFVERPAVERPRPLLARDEEAFLATGETSSPDGAPARDDASVREEASARATEPARPTLSVARLDDSSERRDSPEGDEPPATLKLTPKVEAPKLAESPAKPEPRAYLEPAESEDDSADAPASSEPTTPFVSPRGVQSLADMTQASTAVTDWGPAATVDRFEYPEVCDNLLAVAADEFSALADEIARSSQDGGKLYLAASCQGNEGATTVVLCVARTLAARGLRTVVVDQDVTHPGLAEAL